MDIKAYLQRINYHGSLEPLPQILRQLQVAHLRAVPFENLSIHSKQPIILEDDALFAKIVERKRGGFCYELNGLFAALLRGLGFKVTMLAAGVANADGEFGPEFDHMTLAVSLKERWLADVGFGDSFLEPLLLDETGEQKQDGRAYRIAPGGAARVLMQREGDGEWRAQYRFTLIPYQYADFEEMCRYHQTSEKSYFTQGRICTRVTTEGRITLSEMRLITTAKGGDRQERLLGNEEEYAEALREHFGIVMEG